MTSLFSTFIFLDLLLLALIVCMCVGGVRYLWVHVSQRQEASEPWNWSYRHCEPPTVGSLHESHVLLTTEPCDKDLKKEQIPILRRSKGRDGWVTSVRPAWAKWKVQREIGLHDPVPNNNNKSRKRSSILKFSLFLQIHSLLVFISCSFIPRGGRLHTVFTEIQIRPDVGQEQRSADLGITLECACCWTTHPHQVRTLWTLIIPWKCFNLSVYFNFRVNHIRKVEILPLCACAKKN